MRYKMHSRDPHYLPRLPNDEVPCAPIQNCPVYEIETPPLCFVGGTQDFVENQLKIPINDMLSSRKNNNKLQDFLGMIPVLDYMV